MNVKSVEVCHGIPLVLFAFFTAGCAGSTAPNEKLDTAVHDFGTIYEMPEGNRLMHEFPILNEGESIVVPVYISLHG